MSRNSSLTPFRTVVCVRRHEAHGRVYSRIPVRISGPTARRNSRALHGTAATMRHTEMKALALCSLVLLLTLVSANGASYQSSEASGGGDGGQLGDVLLDERMAWVDGVGPDEELDAAAAETKRAFHAMRGKKDDDTWDSDDKRAFHAMRGKRLLAPAGVDSFIAQLRRAVLQGKRGSGFFGMRGKRQLRNGHKSSRTKFVASRGRRSASGEPPAEGFF